MKSITYLLIHLIPLEGYSGEVSDTLLYPGNQGKCNSRSLTSEILSPVRNQMKWSMCLAQLVQQAKLASQLLIPRVSGMKNKIALVERKSRSDEKHIKSMSKHIHHNPQFPTYVGLIFCFGITRKKENHINSHSYQDHCNYHCHTCASYHYLF